ncbi:olfactory receptor 11G2-like [Rhinatrema bivittatum]|uniref:olfactory receptor 11G2-like n=1 Tax=Rhinatrema bivittatum TaxID=194408 RepID=UPI00112BCE69|nr:olfactory receptor 11G2-like [Rhinatrema bivittatum]
MEGYNNTIVTEFVLLGFHFGHLQQILFFSGFLVIYILTIVSNILIIAVVKENSHLHKPMYFFLANFSFLEICYITTTLPKILKDSLSKKKTISATGCFLQFYLFFTFAVTEHFFLMVMAYDRYVAICNPLRYTIIMTEKACIRMALGCWGMGSLVILFPVISLSRMSFCGSLEIDHIVCDFLPLIKFACKSGSVTENSFLIPAWFIILGCFTFIMTSYGHIIATVLKMSSTAGQSKAFSTCVSHLSVVFIFYGTIIFMYVRPSGNYSYNLEKEVSLFYIAVTPLLNPMIYSLRNNEMREALAKAAKKCKGLTRKPGNQSLASQ